MKKIEKLESGLYTAKIRYLYDYEKKEFHERFKVLENILSYENGKKINFFDSHNIILVKYVEGQSYVTEYKTGIKIPICFGDLNNEISINITNEDKDNFYYFILLKYLCFSFISDNKDIYKLQFTDSYYNATYVCNLLKLNSNTLDALIDDYNKSSITYDSLTFLLNTIKENYFNKTMGKIDEEWNQYLEESRTYIELKEKQEEIKRNYQRYFYSDVDDEKKENKKVKH